MTESPKTSPYSSPASLQTSSDQAKPALQWLNAWYDPVANIKTLTSCIALADLNGDGDYKLVVADLGLKLKVWKGTALISESPLMETPVAVQTYFMDDSVPRVPVVAVAAGSNIYIYRNMKPHIKFQLPPITLDTTETEVWNDLKDDKMPLMKAFEVLTELRGVLYLHFSYTYWHSHTYLQTKQFVSLPALLTSLE